MNGHKRHSVCANECLVVGNILRNYLFHRRKLLNISIQLLMLLNLLIVNDLMRTRLETMFGLMQKIYGKKLG